ncbi:hypothetical protein HMSSN036_29900 [Paenibacillus macerans]|nr:hypothetical protein HMSSN036_29900 [Paenibacillus macerans]
MGEGGRGLSIWDTYTRIPGNIRNGDNGDIACDSYHRYEEDISYMKNSGLRPIDFRYLGLEFSLTGWARLTKRDWITITV